MPEADAAWTVRPDTVLLRRKPGCGGAIDVMLDVHPYAEDGLTKKLDAGCVVGQKARANARIVGRGHGWPA